MNRRPRPWRPKSVYELRCECGAVVESHDGMVECRCGRRLEVECTTPPRWPDLRTHSQSRIGLEWRAEDHAFLLHVLSECDRLAQAAFTSQNIPLDKCLNTSVKL
jgi:hypothetical protein